MSETVVCSCGAEMHRVYNEQGNGLKKTHECPDCGNCQWKMIPEIVESRLIELSGKTGSEILGEGGDL